MLNRLCIGIGAVAKSRKRLREGSQVSSYHIVSGRESASTEVQASIVACKGPREEPQNALGYGESSEETEGVREVCVLRMFRLIHPFIPCLIICVNQAILLDHGTHVSRFHIIVAAYFTVTKGFDAAMDLIAQNGVVSSGSALLLQQKSGVSVLIVCRQMP